MITIAVIEDLVMALYLPFLAALLLGDDAIGSILAGVIAVTVVIVVLAIALRIEVGLSRVVFSRSDEALLLSILGFAFLIAGLAEVGKFSAAVGALLAGIILSGPAARSAQTLVRPSGTCSPRSSSRSSACRSEHDPSRPRLGRAGRDPDDGDEARHRVVGGSQPGPGPSGEGRRRRRAGSSG